MRRLVSLCSAVAALCAVAVATAPAAGASANSVTLLATARFDHFVVDDATGVQKIFSSRGPGSPSLLVTDLAGGNRTNVGGLGGVTGLARSADGATVYAAASDAHQVVAIDATQDPPAVLGRLQLPDDTCPTSVAVAHQTLFFGYTTGNTAGACDADSGDIGSADFSVPAAPTSTLGLRDGVDLPGSVELAGAGDVLAAGVVASNAAVGVYDVSSGTPSAVTPAATPDFGGCASLRSLALTTDGSSLLLACGVPSKVVSVSTTDLTDGPTFPSGQSDHAAAAAAHDGFVAAGFDTADQHDVFVFSADGTKLASSYAFGSDALAVGGLQYGADGTLYAVSHDASFSHWSLHVLHDSTKYAVQIAATTTKPAHTGDPVTVSGTVGSTIDPFTTAPTVQLSRTDLAGRHADIASQQAGPDGSFTFTDSHQVGGRTIGGPVTYTVSFAGDDAHRAASHSVRLTIPRQPTSISIHSNRSTFGYGGLARIRVHLGVNPTFNSKRVAVYLTPYQGRRVRIANRDVDADGNLAMSHRVYRRSTFMAVFAGDFLHEPARDSVTVRAHGRITERLRGFYGSTGGYRLYHPGSSPELDGRLWPHQSGVCLIFRAQYHSNGAWHTASTSPCVSTNSEGRAAALLNNALDLPYRLRAEWRGNTLSMATHGAWMKLKFR